MHFAVFLVWWLYFENQDDCCVIWPKLLHSRREEALDGKMYSHPPFVHSISVLLEDIFTARSRNACYSIPGAMNTRTIVVWNVRGVSQDKIQREVIGGGQGSYLWKWNLLDTHSKFNTWTLYDQFCSKSLQSQRASLWSTKKNTTWTKTRFAIAWAGNQMKPLFVNQFNLQPNIFQSLDDSYTTEFK